MRTNYPEYYKGPKAGGSEDKEWLAVTEFQAFMYIYDNTWFYSDFDCWLAARDKEHFSLGEKQFIDTIRKFQEAYTKM